MTFIPVESLQVEEITMEVIFDEMVDCLWKKYRGRK
jgi:hypothetical protein